MVWKNLNELFGWLNKFLGWGFPGGSDGKESACNAGDLGLIPWRKEWMATHSNILAWRTPWIEEPGGLQSIGLQRVGHSLVTNTFTFHSFSKLVRSFIIQ